MSTGPPTTRTGALGTGALGTGARRGLAVTLLTGVVAAGSLAGAGSAVAHESLIGVDPADGSTAATVPASVTLRFEEPPARLGIGVAVLGPTGEVVIGPPAVVGSSIRVALRPGSPAGSYRVSWRVTSDDGHPVQGTTRFTAAAGSAATVTPTSTPTAPTSTAPTSTAPAPTAPAPTASGRGTTVAVVLGLVVLAAIATAVVSRRRGR